MRLRRIMAVALTVALAGTLGAPGLAAAQDAAPPAASPAPVLLVRSFSTAPSDVMLGQRFTLTLTLRNETKTKAKDVVVSLGNTSAGASSDTGSGSGASGVELVSLDSSDVRFIGDIKGHASASVTFDLISSPRASAGVFSLPVNISSDVSGARVQSSQNIGLVIGRTATFSEQNVEFPSDAVVGETFGTSLDVVNTSSYSVPAVALRLEGDGFTFEDGTLLVGTVEAGDSGTLEAKLTPAKAGDATVTVVASYRDDFGMTREVRFSHRVKVAEQPKEAPKGDGGAKGKEPEGFFASIVSFFMGLFGLGG